jgi:hypothetical protein
LKPNDGEEVQRAKPPKPFGITATTGTKEQCNGFGDETGYITDARRIGRSFVFWLDVPDVPPSYLGVAGTEWWRHVEGVNWLDVNGPGTFETT